jgi:hypothetical protein
MIVSNLPHSLEKVVFGAAFNQPIYYLPPNVSYIQFGHSFNQNVDFLPPKVHTIKFGHKFNRSVDRLPSGLLHLEFGTHFDKSIKFLPRNLQTLILGQKFSKYFNNVTCDIKYLSTWRTGLSCFTNLEKMQIITKETIFPNIILSSNLLWLSIVCSDSISPTILVDSSRQNIPPTVTHLSCTNVHIADIFKLPPKLVWLHVGGREGSCVTLYSELPTTLTHIQFEAKIDISHLWFTNLPDHVTHLSLPDNYDHPTTFPKCLTHLELGRCYNQPLDNLPLSLSHLSIGCFRSSGSVYCHTLDNLPDSITHLFIHVPDFTHTIHRFPNSLLHLAVYSSVIFPYHHSLHTLWTYHVRPYLISHFHSTSYFYSDHNDFMPKKNELFGLVFPS